MLEAIGGATHQGGFQPNIHSSEMGKDVIIQESAPLRKPLAGEGLKQTESAEPEADAEECTQNRTKLKDGNIIIEAYAENGELVKITPPGYLPFGEIA